jgi:hypothetical protein
MSRLGVEQLSALGLMPLEFVDLVPPSEGQVPTLLEHSPDAVWRIS